MVNASSEPVLLESATGVNSDQNYAWNYERAFRANGIPYCTTNQPGADATNLGDIQVRGQYIVYAIRQMHAMSGRRIAVMGHSQGGMVMRWALRFWPDTRPMVEDVVGMAGSNHGTTLADSNEPGQPANLQQAANSNFTQALNSYQETFAGIDYTEIYTHTDEVVKPNDDSSGSSSVHGPGRITNIAIQEICPAAASEHLIIGTTDPIAYALFIDALANDGPADPSRISPLVCATQFQPGFDPVTGPGDAIAAAVALEMADYPEVNSEPPLACYVTATCAGASATGAPAATLAAATVASTASVRPAVRVIAGSAGAGADHLELDVQRTPGSGAWQTIDHSMAPGARVLNLIYGATYRFRARTVTANGATGAYSYATTVAPLDDTRGYGRPRFSANWTHVRSGAAYGYGFTRSIHAGNLMTAAFRGSRVYLIGRRGPFGGRALVSVDGQRAFLNLYSRRPVNRAVIFTRAVNPRILHRIALVTLRPAVSARRNRVEIDGLGVLR